MTEQHSDIDWFRHFHRTTISELLIIENEIELPEEPTQKILVKDYQETLNRIISSLKASDKPDPETVFKNGLAALTDIDKQRFLIENLLEAVKHGKSLKQTLYKYSALGLTNIEIENPEDDGSPSGIRESYSSNIGAGRLLQGLLGNLKKIATKTIRLLINAMMVGAKFVGIKPSIGFSGPFPTFSLQFDLEMQAITVHELFQDLADGFGVRPSEQ